MLLEIAMIAAAAQAAEVIGERGLANAKGWVPIEGSPPAETVREDGAARLKLPCPFSALEGWRAGWDFPLEAQLEGERWIRLRVRADDPGAVSSVILYFESGNGWYTQNMGGVTEKWATLIAERAGFGTEGTPAGWHGIKRIRISITPAAKRDTAVYVGDLKATSVMETEDATRIGPYDSLEELRQTLRKDPAVEKSLRQGEELLKRAGRYRRIESPEAQKLLKKGRGALVQAYLKSQRPREPEFRGIWCHRGTGPGMGWTKAVNAMADNGLNALFPNLLWSGVAYYQSKVVPVAPEVEKRGDQLKEILKAARRRGVQVHVWKVCWQFGGAAGASVAVPFRFQGRMMVNREGRQGEWLCPSNEKNRKYELDAIRELVRNYEIDGFHLDYIRYPGDEFCFCPTCRANFEAGLGRRLKDWPVSVTGEGRFAKRYRDWRLDVITSFVAEVREEIKKINRDVKLSAAVFPGPDSARESVLQDWTSWVREGLLDFVCPMNYTESLPEMRSRLDAARESVKGKIPVYPGLYTTFGPSQNQKPDMLAAQIVAAREMDAEGFVLFEMQNHVLSETLPLLRMGVTAPLKAGK